MFKEWVNTLYFLWRQARYERVAANQVICKGPGHLVSAHLSSDGVGVAAAQIYDGESAVEDRLLDLAALTGGNDSFCPCFPIPFKKALYVAVGSNVTSVTVHFMTRKE